MIDPKSARPSTARVLLSLGVLALGLVRLPEGWALTAREAARSLDPARSTGSTEPGGYYEGLIDGARDPRGEPSPLELRLVGDPIDRNRDLVQRITLKRKHDFLQFELKPDYHDTFFGKEFNTNASGMRDHDYTLEKPANVFRIVLLGASIDMGWGVGDDETYENRLEVWLNAEARRRGLTRRFEVLNFAMAAYGPVQRYEILHRKALGYQPDLVLFASTMLDARLLEIHLGGLIKNRVDLKYDFFRQATREAGIDVALENSDNFKATVKERYWTFADAVMGALADDCRSIGLPLVTLLVPRASRDDASDARALAVARQHGIAARHAVPLIDLSATFDGRQPSEVEVAPGDDHPSGNGHRLLFEALSRKVEADPALVDLLFATGK
jgi:hypothetical protein